MKESIYLSGSIEFSSDAYTWRHQMEKELNLKYHIIVPAYKDPPYSKSSEQYKKWVYNTFIRPDIIDVIKSKYIFVKIDKGVLNGAGTISEVCFASFYKKHIIYMLDDGLTEKDLPGWLVGSLYKAKKVKSIEEAIKFYKNKGK